MGIIRMGPPTKIISKLQEAYSIKKFVETGTYCGDTAYWASKVFEHVLTIEYSESIYKQVKGKYSFIKNVDFLYGNTKILLNEIVEELDTPSIFWLDAHWSGGETYGETEQCPLIEEIEIINHSKYENFIFIDDARLFMSPPPFPHSIEQWPNINTVFNLLNSGKVSRYIVIIEDVIVAVPSFAKLLVAQYCQDCQDVHKKAVCNSSNRYSDSQHKDEASNTILTKEKFNGIVTNSGLKILSKFISAGNVVFDIGSNTGNWCKEVLTESPGVKIHLFEPVIQNYQALLQNLNELVKAEKISPNNFAISDKEELRIFYYYEDFPSLSAFYRRLNIENKYTLKLPKSFPVLTTTLDNYCQRVGVNRINLLNIDAEGAELTRISHKPLGIN